MRFGRHAKVGTASPPLLDPHDILAASPKRLASNAMACYTLGMAKKRNPPKPTPPTARRKRPKADDSSLVETRLDALYGQIHDILVAARNRAWQAVNAAMVDACWEVGRVIVEEEQAGSDKAGYGKRVIAGLSLRLQEEFGRGYDRSNLFHMRAFFLSYPKVDALR